MASYVPLINALKFPGRAAVFTGETLTVPDGAVHVIDGDDPVVLNYGRIVVGKNATIRFQTAAYLQCQIFTQEPGGAADVVDAATAFFAEEASGSPADLRLFRRRLDRAGAAGRAGRHGPGSDRGEHEWREPLRRW